MNWRRELFRVWTVASIGWITFTAWDVYEAATTHQIQLDWWKVMAWAVVPPTTAGLLVEAAYWVAQGFRRAS